MLQNSSPTSPQQKIGRNHTIEHNSKRLNFITNISGAEGQKRKNSPVRAEVV